MPPNKAYVAGNHSLFQVRWLDTVSLVIKRQIHFALASLLCEKIHKQYTTDQPLSGSEGFF